MTGEVVMALQKHELAGIWVAVVLTALAVVMLFFAVEGNDLEDMWMAVFLPVAAAGGVILYTFRAKK